MENPSSSRNDRKTIEKNRRNQMKALYTQLNSLGPHQNSKGQVSVTDQLYEAEKYIKKLQISVEKLKERKDSLMGIERSFTGGGTSTGRTTNGTRLPQIEIHENGVALEIGLITGLDSQFIFNQIIRMLYEEGVEIVNASFSVAEDTVFHSIHSKLEESASGNEAARISERLRRFVFNGDLMSL